MKGSAFSLRIGKDIKEARTTNRNEAFKATNRLSGRYKKLEEQKEENRKSYTEKEVASVNIVQNNHSSLPIRCSLRNRWHPRGVRETRDRASRVSRRTASPCSRRTTPPRTGWTCCPSAGPLPSTAPRRGCRSLKSTSRSQVEKMDYISRLVFKWRVGAKLGACCNLMQITCRLIRRDCPSNFIRRDCL